MGIVSLGDGVAHDAVSADTAVRSPRIVQVVQVGYGFTHGEKSLMRIQLPAKEHAEQIARTTCRGFQGLRQRCEMRLVVRLQFSDSIVCAVERFSVRGK